MLFRSVYLSVIPFDYDHFEKEYITIEQEQLINIEEEDIFLLSIIDENEYCYNKLLEQKLTLTRCIALIHLIRSQNDTLLEFLLLHKNITFQDRNEMFSVCLLEAIKFNNYKIAKFIIDVEPVNLSLAGFWIVKTAVRYQHATLANMLISREELIDQINNSPYKDDIYKISLNKKIRNF